MAAECIEEKNSKITPAAWNFQLCHKIDVFASRRERVNSRAEDVKGKDKLISPLYTILGYLQSPESYSRGRE